MYDTIDCLLVFFVYMGSFCLLLGIGAFVADYVFPHIPFLNKWLESLPEFEEEDEQFAQAKTKAKHQAKSKQTMNMKLKMKMKMKVNLKMKGGY